MTFVNFSWKQIPRSFENSRTYSKLQEKNASKKVKLYRKPEKASNHFFFGEVVQTEKQAAKRKIEEEKHQRSFRYNIST